MDNSAEVIDILAMGLNHYERKVNRRLLEALAAVFFKRSERWIEPGPGDASERLAEELYFFVKTTVERDLAVLMAVRRRFGEYSKRYASATTAEDRDRHILEFARDLGAGERQLRGDRRALARHFGHEAVSERYTRRHNVLERKLAFFLERLGFLAERLLSRPAGPVELAQEWRRLFLEGTIKPFLGYDGDSRITVAAFRSLSRALRALPVEIQERSVEESTLRFIYRSAMHPRLEVWLQCEALSLLESLSAASLERVLFQRLRKPSPGDDLFVRRRAVEILGNNLERLPDLAELFPALAADPSPFVRQGFAAALTRTPAVEDMSWLEHLAIKDTVPQVRAAALMECLELIHHDPLRESVLRILTDVFAREEDAFVLRAAIHAAAVGAQRLIEAGDPAADAWVSQVLECLEGAHLGAQSTPVRRWAALARERVWCEWCERARVLKARLAPFLATIEPGTSAPLGPELLAAEDDATVGRVLAVLGQEDYGYEIESRWPVVSVTRGHVFGFRLWRFLHEVRNPSPDKRQAFRHTIGRVFRGNLRAPSSILCELAETRVPGEPLFLAEEGGWRPYLPLLDDVLSSLRGLQPRPVEIHSAEGVTVIVPPRTMAGRLAAYSKLALRFPRYAKLRNWRSHEQEAPSTYVRALQDLGFTIEIRPHAQPDGSPVPIDPAVKRFFPLALPWGLEESWARLKEYFISSYDNSIFELAVFAGAATAVFLGRHLHANAEVRRCRQRLPLVVGGWGTRGKSGTERLKAALFSALGYGVVSKTTGCEAMFLHAHPFGKMREMFLFRSYDKATIWEQRQVLRLADQLGAEVFLWECMALTPSYVDVLQHQWVRDDLSTITNTYPDHEDLQGPAGINIPEVIAIFIPNRAKAITTEEQMLPILQTSARKAATSLRCITWLEAGLIAPDVLKRFPYDEHPNNIALVLGLADEIGVRHDFALKEMADRVVPDLGVLKTSPIAAVRGRRVQFVNGCSANERHGTLSNWTRMRFDRQDPLAEPGVWITTVVNNRADRVPRSRVFARILVEDICADRHFLIGGNLRGLVGYIRQAWDAYAPSVSLWPKDNEANPAGVLLELARRFRQPTEEGHVIARLRAMLLGQAVAAEALEEITGLWKDPEALKTRLQAVGLKDNAEATVKHHQENVDLLREYEAFGARIKDAGPDLRAGLDAEFRDLLWRWFHRKIVVVEDYYISGDQLILLIANHTPPGYLNRIMGIQNIKGTGLDFVYRWQAWDTCYRASSQLRSKDPVEAEKGLRALAAFQEYGVLCEEYARETLDAVKHSPVTQSETFQAELAVIVSRFEQAMSELGGKISSVERQSSRFERVVIAIENFLDAGDAVRRRKIANAIYADLVTERISSERAVVELQGLNKRQKGGWLLHKLHVAQTAIVKNVSALLLRATK